MNVELDTVFRLNHEVGYIGIGSVEGPLGKRSMLLDILLRPRSTMKKNYVLNLRQPLKVTFSSSEAAAARRLVRER